jgi:hypothetical protein
MTIPARLLAAVAAVAAAATVVAARPPVGLAAGPPRPEDVVGTWRGTAAWKGCTVAGGRRAAVEVHYRAGGYPTDLAGVRDDLGTVTLAEGTGAALTGTLHDLTVTMTAGRRATMTLASAAGCTATLSLARDATGVGPCDRLLALADVASTCDAAGDDRAAALTRARARAAGWKKLRGARRRAAARTCRTDADQLAATLTTQTCLPGPGAPGSSGIPECDAYVTQIQRLAQCPQMPVAAKQAMQDAIAQTIQGWRGLGDAGVPAEARRAAAQACTQASQALRQAAASMGCPPP